jgi:hypothetical protein
VKKTRAPKKSKDMVIKHETGKNTAGYGFYYYENNSKGEDVLVEKLKFSKAVGIEFMYKQPEDDYYIVSVRPGENEILLTKKTGLNTKVKFSHITNIVSK